MGLTGHFFLDLLNNRRFTVEVEVLDPGDVRDLIDRAVITGASVTGMFDAANDHAVIEMDWSHLKPPIKVFIDVPDVGFDPDVALLRLGIPDAVEQQTH